MCVDRVGLEPTPFSVQGSCASSCATGPVVAGAGIEPAGKAYETSLIPDLPQCARLPPPEAVMGCPTGLEPASSGATTRRLDHFRPRSRSTREESNLRHPLCERGGL